MMMKKQLLFLVMILVPMIANADESGTCGENLTWTFEEATNTLTIYGNGEMANGSIGPSDNGQPWYKISWNVKNIVIENGVTTIGDYAFRYFSNLKSITIPNTIVSIGECAFQTVYLETSKQPQTMKST